MHQPINKSEENVVSTEASIVLKLTFGKGKVIWMGEMTAQNHQITAVNTLLLDIFSIQTHKYFALIAGQTGHLAKLPNANLAEEYVI